MNVSVVVHPKRHVGFIFAVRRVSLFLAVFVWALSGCSGGGGGASEPAPAPSVVLSGQVYAPGGQVASLTRSSPLASVFDLLIPAVQATVSGLLSVADGTRVDLVRVNDAGTVDTLIASTTTSGGQYRFDLTALDVAFTNDLMVLVSDLGVQMRAFATDESVDIDPVSEAVSRLVFEKIASTPATLLDNFTTAEIQALYDSANLLTSLRGASARVDVESTVAAVVALLAADSDIDDFLVSASGPGQSSAGLGDAENLLPLGEGDQWNYEVVASGQTAPYFNAISVTGTKVIGGVTASILSESNPENAGVPTEEYQEKNDQGIFNHGNNDPEDVLTPLFAPYQWVKFPVSLEDRETFINKTGLIWPGDLDGDGKNESFRAVAEATNTGVESVTLPLMVFPAALHRDSELEIVVTFSGQGEEVTSIRRTTEWYAPDVGLMWKNSP